MDFLVKDAFIFKDKIIVLFDQDSHSEKFGQFQNLIALNSEGKIFWKAELPTTDSGDCYYKTRVVEENIIAFSIYSFQCKIDNDSGRIINKFFYK